MHIRKNDTVQIIAGDDAPSTGRVLRVLPDVGKVVVEGINRVYRHVRPNRRNQQGGRLSKEMPVNASNVLLVCPTCRKGVRLGKRVGPEGRKERFCKKCGAGLGFIGAATRK
jgi:large subunit ribosomal protein L24